MGRAGGGAGRRNPLRPAGTSPADAGEGNALYRRVSRARVILLQPGLGALDYASEGSLAPGDIVIAPLGPRDVLGVVWEADAAPARAVPDAKLRAVKARVDAPPVRAPLRRLIDWVADYYLAAPGAVLRMALPSPSALEPAGGAFGWQASGVVPARMTPARAAALTKIGTVCGTVAELARLGGVSDATIRGLIAGGALERVALVPPPAFAAPDADHAPPALETAQADGGPDAGGRGARRRGSRRSCWKA